MFTTRFTLPFYVSCFDQLEVTSGSGLFLDPGFQPEQPDRNLRGFHPSRPLLDSRLVFARQVTLLVERKRVVGPTEAWKGESPSDYDLIWDHLSDLLNRKKLY